VGLDGTGSRSSTPGNATHDSRLSPKQEVIVDNASRIDMVPGGDAPRRDRASR
jgi:hypothetical protein